MKPSELNLQEYEEIKKQVDKYLKSIPFILNPVTFLEHEVFGLYIIYNKYYQKFTEKGFTSWFLMGYNHKEMVQQLIYDHLSGWFEVYNSLYWIYPLTSLRLIITRKRTAADRFEDYFRKCNKYIKKVSGGCLGAEGLFDSIERLYELEKRRHEDIEELDIKE